MKMKFNIKTAFVKYDPKTSQNGFYNIFCAKIYSLIISVADWMIEWQTEDSPNVNMNGIETFFIIQSKTKISLCSEFVLEQLTHL